MKSTKSGATIFELKLFQYLTGASKSLLERGLRYALFNKPAPVLQKGQPVSGAYVVVGGQLRVFTLSPEGNEATLYLINRGETCVLALNCIFNDLLYPAWVQTGASTKIAVIPGDVYKVLFESEPVIRNMTIQAFSTVVFRLMSELEDIHAYKLDQRLANFLLLHASTDHVVRMTQQQIASHLGTSREVIARALRQFAAKGLIHTGRNQITIHHPVGLAQSPRRDESGQGLENVLNNTRSNNTQPTRPVKPKKRN